MGLVIQRVQRLDREFAVFQAGAADVTNVVLPGIKRAGLIGVRIVAVATDRGVLDGGAALAVCRFVATPSEQSDEMGGATQHSYAAQDTFNQNRIPFGVILRPGEDLTLAWTNGAAGRTVRVRFERELLFGEFTTAGAAPAK